VLGVLLLGGCGSGSGRRVLVIGLDGATFEVLDELFAQGLLPNLAALRERGAHGELQTTVPVISPPAWTSATTGVNPGKHNIFDFFRMPEGPGPPPLASARDRRADPVWRVLNEAGLETGVMNIPMTFPPDSVDGFFISGFPYGRITSGITFPRALEKKIAVYPLDPFGESIQPGQEGRLLSVLRHTFDRHVEVAKQLMQEEDWDLFWVVFTGTDKVQHFYWKFADPNHPAYDPVLAGEFGTAIRDFFVRADRAVGELVELAGPETDILVLSDHGFGPIYRELRLNSWLEQEGFLTRTERGYSRVEAMAPGPFDGLVRVNQAGRDFAGTVPAARAAEVRDDVRARLERLVDPETGGRVVEEIWAKEDVYDGPYLDNAPDLVFVAAPRCFVGRDGQRPGEAWGRPSYTFSGYHRRNGILLAAGPSFPPNPSRGQYSILDVAPTIYWLFDVDLPRDLDGRVPPGLVGEAALAARPPRIGERTVVIDPEDAVRDDASREAIEALPYVR
jgi:predicted AlkP superfamily phosphohydrolase/phosphomutase